MAENTRPWSSISKWSDTPRGALTVLKWKSLAQSCLTVQPMYYMVHGILQARILEWVVFPFSRGSSQRRDRTQVSHLQILYQLSHLGSPRILEWVAYTFSSGSSPSRNWTGVSCIAGGFFTNWAIGETHDSSKALSKDQGVVAQFLKISTLSPK